MSSKLMFAAICLVAFFGWTVSESCITCNSASDVNCVQQPWVINPRDCANQSADTRCYTRIVDGHTLRGCSDEWDPTVLQNCTADSNCVLCTGLNNQSGCNNEVFPTHRQQCHICDGNLNSTCSNEIQTNSSPCPVFNGTDSCFIRRSPSNIERGCLSSSGTSCNKREHCYICEGHGCNRWHFNHTEIPTAPSSAVTPYASMALSVVALVVAKFISA